MTQTNYCLKTIFGLLLCCNNISFAMSDFIYERQIAFLDAYMRQNIDAIGQNSVVIEDYEDSHVCYALTYQEIQDTLFAANQKIAVVCQEKEFPEIDHATQKLINKNTLLSKDKYFLIVANYLDFITGKDLVKAEKQIKENLYRTIKKLQVINEEDRIKVINKLQESAISAINEAESQRIILKANRQLYQAAWATRDPEKIQESLHLNLYQKKHPYIPFGQKLKEFGK
jgi:hypothetical protein